MSNVLRMARSQLGLAIVLAMLASSAQAAEKKEIGKMSFKSAAPVTVADLAGNMGLESFSRLEVTRSAPTVHGTRTVRMQQTWRGIPIFGATATVEAGDGDVVTRQQGDVYVGLATDLPRMQPKLSSMQAMDLLRKQSIAAVNATVEPRDATLMIYPQENGKARLAYHLSYFVGGEHPSRPTAIMDADTGEVLEQWEGLTHAEAHGPGGNEKTGRYIYGESGLAALNVKQSGAYCSTETENVATYHLKNSTNLGSGAIWQFLCPTSQGDAVNGGYGPINDAHHFGQVVFDMYRSYLDASPLKARLALMVHYGRNYENAFWNGRQMAFGDGQSAFYPLVGLDVIAHEVSHGFTEQNSGLVYSRQSGGMNEAFSDMAGDAAEWFDRGESDQMVGADIVKAKNSALRYMCEPRRDGRSIDHASKYYNGLDVHYSSGVYNKAYCELVKSDDWNPEKAFKAFARANMLYWKASETFDGGACGVVSAATDLGLKSSDVVDAFKAVGVVCKR
ncbi:M4 family metallopeptidase [Dyella sp. GSA-30]|uniref:M4 family metallopeptidase n=1 Tax=Dyella sp. GSA-30 TaxID=2994496 RepID=UPI0024938DCA|nr:M4 family metallopeptidase [Dyella sp. GSA-30]BDU22790.1 hemagglutinin [Dyella sp. GSA-30]